MSQHKKLLELTVYNCDLAIRATGIIEELVAEGCAAIKARYDKTNQELADLGWCWSFAPPVVSDITTGGEPYKTIGVL